MLWKGINLQTKAVFWRSSWISPPSKGALGPGERRGWSRLPGGLVWLWWVVTQELGVGEVTVLCVPPTPGDAWALFCLTVALWVLPRYSCI